MSLLVAGALCALAAPAGAVTDPLPISPNQYFGGQVNGTATNAVIRTNCTSIMKTGNPAAGQYVEASLAVSTANSLGYTGSAGHALAVTLSLPSSTSVNAIGTLAGYNIELAIPTTLKVPCAGSGNVVFAPTPTSATARAAVVPVTFISLIGTP